MYLNAQNHFIPKHMYCIVKNNKVISNEENS